MINESGEKHAHKETRCNRNPTPKLLTLGARLRIPALPCPALSRTCTAASCCSRRSSVSYAVLRCTCCRYASCRCRFSASTCRTGTAADPALSRSGSARCSNRSCPSALPPPFGPPLASMSGYEEGTVLAMPRASPSAPFQSGLASRLAPPGPARCVSCGGSCSCRAWRASSAAFRVLFSFPSPPPPCRGGFRRPVASYSSSYPSSSSSSSSTVPSSTSEPTHPAAAAAAAEAAGAARYCSRSAESSLVAAALRRASAANTPAGHSGAAAAAPSPERDESWDGGGAGGGCVGGGEVRVRRSSSRAPGEDSGEGEKEGREEEETEKPPPFASGFGSGLVLGGCGCWGACICRPACRRWSSASPVAASASSEASATDHDADESPAGSSPGEDEDKAPTGERECPSKSLRLPGEGVPRRTGCCCC